jgi:hypothetical protein
MEYIGTRYYVIEVTDDDVMRASVITWVSDAIASSDDVVRERDALIEVNDDPARWYYTTFRYSGEDAPRIDR